MKDLADFMAMVMSCISFRSRAPGANGVRTKQVLSRFGWCEVRFPYRVGSPEASDVFKAFGIERKMTRFASEAVTRLAVARRCKQAGMHWRLHNAPPLSTRIQSLRPCGRCASSPGSLGCA